MFFRGTFITWSTLTSFMTANGIKATKICSSWNGQLSGASWSLTWLHRKGWREERGRRKLGPPREEARTDSTFMVGGLELRWGQLGWEKSRPFITSREQGGASLRPGRLVAEPVWRERP